jgi:toxin-antitoxin system PIN domain toxin
VLVVDTNILVYAANRLAPEHEPSRAFLDHLRSQPTAWFLTWGIAFEFLRVATHPRVFVTPWTAEGAWRYLDMLLAAPGARMLVPTHEHARVVSTVIANTPTLAGNLFHDAETVALMLANGIRRIATRDTDFHRFRDIEVVDPLRDSAS